MKNYLCYLAVIVSVAFFLSACGGDSFSQYPGFDKIRSSLSDTPPNAAEQQLLSAHRPLLYIAANAEGPVDFYADYIAHGLLFDGHGKQQKNNSVMLNRLRHDSKAIFEHHPETLALITPSAYGGVYRATVNFALIGETPLTFLSYHFVFRHSGLPAGLSSWLHSIADIFADREDWHQLDHYTAIFIVLSGDKPIAVILQQHNYMRTYLIGEDIAFSKDKPMAIDVAISSNELYPHRLIRTTRRAAGNMSSKTIDYLIGTKNSGGFFTASDITHGVRQATYQLRFLAPNDAFYVFEGHLGESRLLPGRDGPPGAIYRNLPALSSIETALYYFYWREGDTEYANIIHGDNFDGETLNKAVEKKLKSRFAAALEKSGLLPLP